MELKACMTLNPSSVQAPSEYLQNPDIHHTGHERGSLRYMHKLIFIIEKCVDNFIEIYSAKRHRAPFTTCTRHHLRVRKSWIFILVASRRTTKFFDKTLEITF